MHTPMRAVSAHLHARAKDIEIDATRDFRSAPRTSAYWALLDLRGSAAYRIASGDERSYVRAQTFFGLVSFLADSYPSTMLFKMLGDGALVRSEDAREIVEISIALDAVNQYWRSDVSNSPSYPSLECGVAITRGDAIRVGSDFLGTPIDMVARISGVKYSSESQFAVVHDDAKSSMKEWISSDYPFISFGPSRPVDQNLLKAGERQQRVAAAIIDRGAFQDYSDFFRPLREALDRAPNGL